MICASCGDETAKDPCERCDRQSLLAGRYRLERIVGRGAMGVTYRGVELAGGAPVAIKEIPYQNFQELKDMELARREATVLGQLDHPCIPRYREHLTFGTGKHAALYIVQDFIDGRTLRAELEKRRYTEQEVLEVVLGVLDILEYLHGLSPPIIHRDVKPGNIIRRASDGALVLIDFGSVRDALKDARTGGSTIAGTFGYMAPEQFMGQATPASDLYALGVLAVELLSRNDPQEMLAPGGGLIWERSVNASEPTKALLRLMLEQDPGRRISSAGAVRASIQRIRSGPPLTARAVPKKRPKKRPKGGGDLPATRTRRGPLQNARPSGKAWLIGAAVVLAVQIAWFIKAPSHEPSAGPESIGPYRSAMPAMHKAVWCSRGFARACAELGVAYETATGVRRDLARAFSLFEQTCARDNAVGCAGLARAYRSGEFAAPSPEKAAQYFARACELGDQKNCGMRHDQNQAAQ